MDGDPGSIRGSLIEKLSQKASLSQKVFDNTFSVFGRLKCRRKSTTPSRRKERTK